MKKLIYAIGVSLFLAFMAFHVTVSLTNPYWGVSVEALAQGSGSGGTEENPCEDCLPEEDCIEGECILVPSNCLVVADAQSGTVKTTGKCFSDTNGPDNFCGFTNTCTPAEIGVCNPHGCLSVPGCYSLPI